MPQAALRFLHISDIHYAARSLNSPDRDLVWSAMLSDLREQLHGATVDLVFLTGDIAYSGKAEEYELAAAHLETLLQLLQISRDRVFLVPGNHDVDRSLVTASAAVLHSAVRADPRLLEQVLLDKDPNGRASLFAKFMAYAAFVTDHFALSTISAETPYYAATFSIERGAPINVAVVGVNSALISEAGAGPSGAETKGRLVVGAAQVQRLLQLATRERDPHVVIALMHHPTSWLTEADEASVRPLLDAKADVLLTGHEHDARINRCGGPSKLQCAIASGSTYAGSEFQGNGYSIVSLTIDTAAKRVLSGRVLGRSWSLRSLAWDADRRLGQSGAHEWGAGEPKTEKESVSEERKEWTPRTIHPLQPAPHFSGRGRTLTELRRWWSKAKTDKVVALVAAGGTGKTACIAEFLSWLHDQEHDGLFVWSFYEEPSVDAFLSEACRYWWNIKHETWERGLLTKLQHGLGTSDKHLIVLDGLELIQSEGARGRLRGSFDDHQMKLFARYMAGSEGKARLLMTTRFPVVDLENWQKHGYREISLEDLDPIAGVQLLRKWGVLGSERQIEDLGRSVGWHALSLAVLGSYLGNFCHGDPLAARRLGLQELDGHDRKALKLGRILDEYRKVLADEEVDLLARLSAFPNGLSSGMLTPVINAGGRIAGSLGGKDPVQLSQILARLNSLGLAFGYKRAGMDKWNAHPFVREYFAGLLGKERADMHRVVSASLSSGLEARPGKRPATPDLLDRYEEWIEQMRLAGETKDAVKLYAEAVGGYKHLGNSLGDYTRGIRIVSGFARNNCPALVAQALEQPSKWRILFEWGQYAKAIGDLNTAAQAFREAVVYASNNQILEARAQAELSSVELSRGELTMARACALRGALLAESNGLRRQDASVIRVLATIFHYWREDDKAAQHFFVAREVEAGLHHGSALTKGEMDELGNPGLVVEVEPAVEAMPQVVPPTRSRRGQRRVGGAAGLGSADSFLELEWMLLSGRTSGIEERVRHDSEACTREKSARGSALLALIHAGIALSSDGEKALSHVADAIKWYERTGDVEIGIRAKLLMAEILHKHSDAAQALREATMAIQLAEACAYGLLVIRGSLLAARMAGRGAVARKFASKALDLSSAPSCGWADAASEARSMLRFADE